jgi:hypothetical protein
MTAAQRAADAEAASARPTTVRPAVRDTRHRPGVFSHPAARAVLSL